MCKSISFFLVTLIVVLLEPLQKGALHMLNELNEVIEKLEQEVRKNEQALERKREERRRLEMQIKMMSQKEERNRIHKMIVLGSTLCAEMQKWGGGEYLYKKILAMPDSAMIKVGRMFADGYRTSIARKENSDNV